MVHAIKRSAQDFIAQKIDSRQVFLSYYPNRLRTIFKNVDGRSWFTLNTKSPLQDQLLLDAVSGQKGCFRGLRWGEFTRFVVLDVDTSGQYHNATGLTRIREALTVIGIKDLCFYRSGISDGWHIYVPLDSWEKSEEVTGLLKSYFRALKLDLRSGQLEIFPSGAGLRLPLQLGFAWLNEDGSVLIDRAELSAAEALDRFVQDIESGTNSWGYTKSRITEFLQELEKSTASDTAPDRDSSIDVDGFDQLFEHKILAKNYELGKKFWRDGLTRNGERHDAVVAVEHYLWFGDSAIGLPAYPGRANDATRAEKILSWLRLKHNGFCSHINRNDWRPVQEQVRRACAWRAEYIPERKPYVLVSERAIERIISQTRYSTRTWTTRDWQKGNEKRMVKARQKIEDAVNYFLSEGVQISQGAICERTRCSPNTVKKHADLWKHLAIGSGDLEPGVRPGVGDLGFEVEFEKEMLVLVEPDPSLLFPVLGESANLTEVCNSADLVSVTRFTESCDDAFVSQSSDLTLVGLNTPTSVVNSEDQIGETSILGFKPVGNGLDWSLPTGVRKRRFRGKRGGDARNGQLVIDFGAFRDRIEQEKRGPPAN